jgi:glycosyltransferase involved in cell wall biosynthesis
MSVVIPAYNEERRIGPTLEAIRDYAVRAGQAWEVVIVDDGSTDETEARIVRHRWEPLDVHLLRNERNRGKGFSVRRGMLAAEGEVLLACDADQSAGIEQVEKLLPWLDRGYDVVVGSRDLPRSVLDPPQPPWRRLPAVIFRGIRRRLMLPDLRDTQCGFKCFRRDAAREVFRLQALDGWLFDCEVLGIADRLGWRVKEVGILWGHNPDSRVNALREALTALPTLLAIRRRLARLERA